jgi:hypothetical protein
MAYALPRVFIAAIGWVFTCVAMWTAWPQVDAMAACYTAALWAAAAAAYIAYLRKLRREFQEVRVAKAELKLAALRMIGRRMRQAEAAQHVAAAAHPLDRAA